jgi:phage terminase small subunit
MAGLTQKQETFCQAYIETGNASEAYRTAYAADKMKAEAIHVKASELLSSGKVAVRVAELRAEIKQRHNVTVDSLIKELEEARQAALGAETPQSSAAVSATMGKAKLAGLDKQIVEMTGAHGGPVQTVTLSAKEFEEIARKLNEEV